MGSDALVREHPSSPYIKGELSAKLTEGIKAGSAYGTFALRRTRSIAHWRLKCYGSAAVRCLSNSLPLDPLRAPPSSPFMEGELCPAVPGSRRAASVIFTLLHFKTQIIAGGETVCIHDIPPPGKTQARKIRSSRTSPQTGAPQGGISCPSGNSPPGDLPDFRKTCVFRVENAAFNGGSPKPLRPQACA